MGVVCAWSGSHLPQVCGCYWQAEINIRLRAPDCLGSQPGLGRRLRSQSLSKLCNILSGNVAGGGMSLPVALTMTGPEPHLMEGEREAAADEALHGVTGLGVGHRVHRRPPLVQPVLRLHLRGVHHGGVHHLRAGVHGVHHLGLRAAGDCRHVGAAGWELDPGGQARGLLLVRGGRGRGRGGHVTRVVQIPAPWQWRLDWPGPATFE